jgi:hypothetical protein
VTAPDYLDGKPLTPAQVAASTAGLSDKWDQATKPSMPSADDVAALDPLQREGMLYYAMAWLADHPAANVGFRAAYDFQLSVRTSKLRDPVPAVVMERSVSTVVAAMDGITEQAQR